MHFSLATTLAIVPLLTSASPLTKQPPVVKIPLSKRSNLHLPDGSVNLEKLSGHVTASMAKFKRSLDNYERNTGKRHAMQPEIVSAGSKRQVGIEPLDDERDEGTGNYWTGFAYVGTPDTQFNVVIDTEYGDTFLPGPNCGSSCSGHTIYDPSTSSTSQPINGGTFVGRYDDIDSVATGVGYTDTVTIAGFTATSLMVAAATNYDYFLRSANFAADGVLGIGWQTDNFYGTPSFVVALRNQGQITSSVFAFKLVQDDGELTIGGLNNDLYSGTPFYVPLQTPGYWEVLYAGFVGGSTTTDGGVAYFRSGNPFTYGPQDTVNGVYSQITGSQDASGSLGPGFYTFPCSSTIPPISFTFGGIASGSTTTVGMSASSFNFGLLSPGSSTCVGSMVAFNENFAVWILGDGFMRNTYTIFDYDQNAVGFATLV